MHVDLDAFYASVEQCLRPHLQGQPVIVGGSGASDSRGVVCAASYEARRHGVHSAMPLRTARRLCPQAVFLPTDFPAYRRYSARVFAILKDYSPVIEPLALDEAYLDLTGSAPALGPPVRIGQAIQGRVEQDCGLTISIGIGSSKLVAKIASGLGKPRGLVAVASGDEAAFVQQQSLRALPGLGPAAAARLETLGIRTVAGLASLPVEFLAGQFGSFGRTLHEFAHGVDPRPVLNPGPPKSVSREVTFERDTRDAARLERTLRELTQDVGAALRGDALLARTLSLKIRYRPFATLTRQVTLEEASHEDPVLMAALIRLLQTHRDPARAVRLLGVAARHLESGAQLNLFRPAALPAAALDRRLDALRERYGRGVIQRGPGPALRQRDFHRQDLDAVLRRWGPRRGGSA